MYYNSCNITKFLKIKSRQLCDVCWVRDNHLTSLQTPGSTCRLERCLHTQPASGEKKRQTADQQKRERLLANHLNELMITSILLSKRKTRAIGTQVWNQTELRVQSISHGELFKTLKWKERACLFSHYIVITGLLTFRKTQGQAQITWTVLFGKLQKKGLPGGGKTNITSLTTQSRFLINKLTAQRHVEGGKTN